MAPPLTPAEIRAALTAFGIKYREIPGWEKRGNGGTWGDIAGFMWHHTGDDALDSIDRRVVTDGHAALSGPLCNFGINDDGIVDLVAAGPANHAGGGDPRVLDAVRKESYGDYPPPSRMAHGDAGDVIGNPLFYGVEVYYFKTLSAAANKSMVRLAAAIIWALDKKDGAAASWTSKSAIGHKEWQRGKIDPALFDCAAKRREVQALLDAGPGASPTTSEEDELMAITVKDPTTGKSQPLPTVLLSIWIHSIRASRDAGAALAIAKAQAAAGKPLTEAQIAEAAKAGAKAAFDEEVDAATVTLTMKEAAQ